MADVPGLVDGDSEGLELECPVCYYDYNHTTKCPRVLECFHTFCTECLKKIQTHQVNGVKSISCPLCRYPTPLKLGGVLGLSCQTDILARLPVTIAVPTSTTVATVTQQVTVTLDPRESRLIVLPTVSLTVEQREGRNIPLRFETPLEQSLRRQALICVQLLSTLFWIFFILICVLGIVFGPNFLK
ncbi:RING finger domain-containing protein [Latimeria chalumnae]|uniref:RING finger domain-containing protein n=1 Tax=Latimeria chalumnae TaxID=7897 RepID=UPI0003C16C2A|nr:PREDICTED: RING finger protein 224-like [Latimeria chalumnae]|eukprot:XP_005997988.1 PREDICTED: RING finger protein 224-like [Latimeria chalumnae]